MKASVTVKITVEASCEEVFRYFKHLKYHQLWNPHLLKISPLTTIKAGLVYQTTNLLLGVKVKSQNHVLKVVPNQEFEVENTTGPLNYWVKYRLQERPEGTLVTCTSTVTAHGETFAFTKPVLRLLVQRELRSDLQALKLAAEHRL
ncbi:MAG TPA: SRPBCC family protein [Verrucomicrobiae bacterium]|nr:SRPBCC family protein [Verrucomicrobiae bacterium]